MLPDVAVTFAKQLRSDEFIAGAKRLRHAQQALGGGRREQRHRYAMLLADIYVDELKQRSTGIVKALKEAHHRFGSPLGADVLQQLLDIGDEALRSQIEGLEGAYNRHLGRSETTPVSDFLSHDAPLQQAGVQNSLRRYFWTLENVPEPTESAPLSTIMNSNAPVATVQAGAHVGVHVQIFLSTVSAEFCDHRDVLRHYLERPNVSVKAQEDFIAHGGETLEKLDNYIQHCHAVIHLVGDRTGSPASTGGLAAMQRRYPDLAERLPALAPSLAHGAPPLTFTQWEAWLALYHGKMLLIAEPERNASEDATDAEQAAQREHLARLRASDRYAEIRFTDPHQLTNEVLRSSLHDILAQAGSNGRKDHFELVEGDPKLVNFEWVSKSGFQAAREADGYHVGFTRPEKVAERELEGYEVLYELDEDAKTKRKIVLCDGSVLIGRKQK